MTGKTHSDDYERLVRAFDDLFDEVLLQDIEEADEILREAGYDPEDVGVSLAKAAQHALEQSPFDWRNRARREMAKADAQLGDWKKGPKHSRAELIQAIRRFASPQLQATAHFKNLGSLTDADLEKMLEELEYLASQKSKEE